MSKRPKLAELAYMLGVYSNKTIPQTYIMEMSNYELLLALLDKINEIIERCNLYTDAIEEINKILDGLEDYIKGEVERILTQMYDDGVFDDILAKFFADIVPSKIGDIDLQHMGYILHRSHSYGVSVLPKSPFDVDEELYSALQGNCVFSINGQMYWACCYVCQNGSDNEKNNGARIYVYTINQDGSLSYVTDKEYVLMGHCNAMTYLNGYLWITPNSYASNEHAVGGVTTDILRVAFDGTTLGGTDIGKGKYAVERKTPVGWLYKTNVFSDHICAYNNQLYVCDGQMNVYTYDWETNLVTVVYQRINGIEGYTGDGFAIDDNYIYMGAKGYRIKRFNKQAQVIDWVIQLPELCNNKMYKLGEVEGFTIVDGVLYLAGAYNLNGDSTAINTYSVTRFYRQNLYTNNIPMNYTFNWANGHLMQSVSLFVSGNLPDDTMGSRNNIGLTPDDGFGCIQIALDLVESCFWLQRANIAVMQYRNLSTIDIRTTKPIIISGTRYKSEHSGTKPSVGYIHVNSNSNIQFNDLVISNILPASLTRNFCINIESSKVNVENLTFPVGTIINADNVIYAINISRSLMNFYYNDTGAEGTPSTTEKTWNQYKTRFVNAFNSTINGHGLLTTNVNIIA